MAKKKKKIGKKIFLLFVLIILIISAIGGNYYHKNFVAENVDTKGEDVFIFIPRGANEDTVYRIIFEKNILKDTNSFKWLAEKKNYSGKMVVPGKYKIQDKWTNNDLINHLRAGNGRLDAKVVFGNVRDLKQLSAQMTKEILLDENEVYDWLTNKDSINKYGFNQYTIISMFIPNTYYVDFDISVTALMDRMAKEYKTFWNDERKAKLKECKLTQSEATTLASIVYWETNSKKDMPIIAGVYMNRLRIGMPLQADPTLIFALGDYSIKRVLNVHKEVDSPYNTYKYAGLPPGPILIPPTSYIDAVLNHEKHKYLFFVAKEDFSGDSYFAETYSQHLIYAKRYQNALNQKKIYK